MAASITRKSPSCCWPIPNRDRLAEAVAAVAIAYEEEPAIFTIEESLAMDPIVWGEGADANVFKRFHLEHGEVDAAFAAAHFIVEGVYETGAQEQLYIETNGMIGEVTLDPEGRPAQVTVRGSIQCPFYVHRALKVSFGLPDEQVRVIQAETGGAFGGKEDYPSHPRRPRLPAGHEGRPAGQDDLRPRRRHGRHHQAPSQPHTPPHGRQQGRQTAGRRHRDRHRRRSLRDPFRHCLQPRHDPRLRPVPVAGGARALAGRRHQLSPPSGAFRGFGAPQSLFALERHMDKIARTVGLTPEELRRRNFIQTGGTTSTGQRIDAPIDLDALLTRALEESGYHAKDSELFAEQNKTSAIKRGIGFATFMHGAGFTGSGERYLNSLVGLEGTPEGKVRVLVSSAEFGQGTNTILAQIVAETLHADYADVEVQQPDTNLVPNSGPTVASPARRWSWASCSNTRPSNLLETLRIGGVLGDSYTPTEFPHAIRSYIQQFGDLKRLPPL